MHVSLRCRGELFLSGSSLLYDFRTAYSYGRLAAVISYYFTQIVDVMRIETGDLSLYGLI